MDFEAYEWEHMTVTEFGWSCVRFGMDGEEEEETGHLIVKENRHLINTRWVAGNRDVRMSLLDLNVMRRSCAWNGRYSDLTVFV